MVDISKIKAPSLIELRENLLVKLQPRTKQFPADRVADAKQLAADQLQWWRQILSAAEAANQVRSPDRDIIKRITTGLSFVIERSLASNAISEVDSGWLVESKLPILVPGSVEAAKAIAVQDAWFLIAALFYKFSDLHEAGSNSVRGSFADPSIASALTDPRFTRALLQVGALENGRSDELKLNLAKLNQSNNTVLDNLHSVREVAKEQIAQFDDIKADWFKFQDGANAQMETWKEQIADAIKLDANRNLWAARTSRHHKWMIGAFIIMTVGVSMAIIGMVTLALPALDPSVFEILTKSSYVTHKLAIITICIIGVGWILRFVARSIVENMTLKADAQHRQTMLDTYLILRGENAMSDTERHLILAALFRPLPGQGAEELPPSPSLEAIRKVTGH